MVSPNATAALPLPGNTVNRATRDATWAIESKSPLRRLSYYAILVMVFLRFSTLPELLAYTTGQQLYLLYLIIPLAWAGMALTGGFSRALTQRSVFFWCGLLAWMILATPFSYWPGGSVATVMIYIKTDLPMLFFLGGLVMTWQECRRLLYVIAAGMVASIAASRMLTADNDYRLSMEFSGTIANSNDFAAHLVLLMPVVLFIILKPGASKFVRLLAGAAIAAGIYSIMGTASRGAMISLAVSCLILFLRLKPMVRLGMVVGVPVVAILLVLVLPKSTLTRLSIFSTSKTMDAASREELAAQVDATESMATRSYLVQQSITFTLQHPVFGVGPGQFSVAEGGTRTAAGQRGSWHETHNAYTQLSSECGIPGLIFYLCAVVSMLKLLHRIYRQAGLYPHNATLREISVAASCLTIGVVGYSVSIIFLSHGYKFYLPALTGLAVAMAAAAQREIDMLSSGAGAQPWMASRRMLDSTIAAAPRTPNTAASPALVASASQPQAPGTPRRRIGLTRYR